MTKAIIDTGKWDITPDDTLDIQGYHIDSIEYDKRDKTWIISSTFTEGYTYGYRLERNGNKFLIKDAWRSILDDDDKINMDITQIPQSDIDWFIDNLVDICDKGGT